MQLASLPREGAFRRAVVFGGYGTFGGQVCRLLAERGVAVTVVGRDARRAAALAESLDAAHGGEHRAAAGDVRSRESCLATLAEPVVAVNCAGPFSRLCTALLEACLEAGAHYVDIADDRRYVARLRVLGAWFEQADLTAAYGCSSLPSISGALAIRALRGSAGWPERVRVTLFIGNRNPKGLAAVRSAAEQLGRAICAPQGRLTAFADPEIVPLPPPFGPRKVLNIESPDYDVLPALMVAGSVAAKVGFESRLATNLFGWLARWMPRFGRWLVPRLALPSRLMSRRGSSGGAVMAELFFADGSVRRSAVVAPEHGQRMAILPCVEVAERLCKGQRLRRGAATAYELLGADELIAALVAGDGCRVESGGWRVVDEQSKI